MRSLARALWKFILRIEAVREPLRGDVSLLFIRGRKDPGGNLAVRPGWQTVPAMGRYDEGCDRSLEKGKIFARTAVLECGSRICARHILLALGYKYRFALHRSPANQKLGMASST